MVVAHDGEQALARYRESDPEIVLLDIACRAWTVMRLRGAYATPPAVSLCCWSR